VNCINEQLESSSEDMKLFVNLQIQGLKLLNEMLSKLSNGLFSFDLHQSSSNTNGVNSKKGMDDFIKKSTYMLLSSSSYLLSKFQEEWLPFLIQSYSSNHFNKDSLIILELILCDLRIITTTFSSFPQVILSYFIYQEI